MRFTLEEAIEFIQKSNETGWKLKAIEGTDQYTMSRKVTTEELNVYRYERPKKMAEMFIEVIDSDIEKFYEIHLEHDEIHFTYVNDFEELFKCQIELRYDNDNYIIMEKGQKIFESDCTWGIVEFLENQIAKRFDKEKPIGFMNGIPVYNQTLACGIPVGFISKRISSQFCIPIKKLEESQ